MEIKVKKVLGGLLFILGLLFFIDPKSRIFRANELIFGLSLLLSIYLIVYKETVSTKIVLILLLFSVIPMITGLISIKISNYNIDSYYLKQNIVKSLFGLIIIPMSIFDFKQLKTGFMTILKIYFYILSALLVIIFFLYNISPHLENVVSIYTWNNLGLILGINRFLGGIAIPKIFSGNMIYLFIFQAYYLFDNDVKNEPFKYIYILGSMVLCLLNGTAAIALSSILIMVYYVYTRVLKKFTPQTQFIIAFFCGTILLIIFSRLLFNSRDPGNTVKYGHMVSYIKLWKENKLYLLTGTGLGTGFFSTGRNAVVYMTELSYFDIIRVYGLLVGGVMMSILVWPILLFLRDKKDTWLMISYLAIFFSGNTNPYLYGVSGTFFISYVYACLIKENDEIKLECQL